MTKAVIILATLLSIWILAAVVMLWRVVRAKPKLYTSTDPHSHVFDSAVGYINFYNGSTILACKCGALGHENHGYWRSI
jgi:hypothetical protein